MPKERDIERLFDAVKDGNLAAVRRAIERGFPVDQVYTLTNTTPLAHAAWYDREDVFEYLLGRGADHRPPLNWGASPLSFAAGGATDSRLRMVRRLLARKPDYDHAALVQAVWSAAESADGRIMAELLRTGVRLSNQELGAVVGGGQDNPRWPEVATALAAARHALPPPRAKPRPARPKRKARRRGHKPARTVDEAWDRIEAWLKANAKGWKPLARPATPAQIAKLEKAVGRKVPADLRRSLVRHNGADNGLFPFGPDPLDCYGLYTTVDIADAWKEQAELLDDGDFEPNKRPAQRGIRPEHWNKGWLPIADNGAGDHFCVDLAPAKGGTVGQVIHVGHEGPKRTRLGTSVTDWLGRFAADLEAGAYRYEGAEHGLVHA